MAKTLFGLFSKREADVRKAYSIRRGGDFGWVILAQPEGAAARSDQHPVCSYSVLIAEMAKLAGITFNARCFCVQFQGGGVPSEHQIGFSACNAIRNELFQLCTTDSGRKRVAKRYYEIHGRYPWIDGVRFEKVWEKLDEANSCPYRLVHSFDTLPLTGR